MITPTLPREMTSPRFIGGGQIVFHEKTVPTPGPGELLIQVRANALCGSELPQFRDGASITPGHEAAGVVAQAGPGTHVPEGTSGVIYLMDYCGACRSCRLGMTNQCLQKRADMGFTHDGGYGPYELVRENIFFPIPESLPIIEATMLLDVLGTSSHAIRRAKLVHNDPFEAVVVSGAGPVGLGVLAAVKIMLGKETPVFITDFSAYRLELAQRLGGIPVQIQETALPAVMRDHGLRAADLAIDTSGKTAGRRVSFDALDQRGVFVCVGHGEGLNLTISPDMIAPERSVLGSEYFSFGELPANLEMLQSNFDYLRPIITHRYPASAIQEAFETFFAGSTGKVIIEQ